MKRNKRMVKECLDEMKGTKEGWEKNRKKYLQSFFGVIGRCEVLFLRCQGYELLCRVQKGIVGSGGGGGYWNVGMCSF